MSQRTVIIDDHEGSEIDIAQAIQTGTSITIQRGAEGITAWDGLNLTDASFAKLVKVIQEFVSAEPQAQPDEPAQTSQPAQLALVTPEAAPKPVATPDASKRDSKAVRAWYYALDAASLKALSLPTPDRSRNIGKLPADVNTAYDQAHS